MVSDFYVRGGIESNTSFIDNTVGIRTSNLNAMGKHAIFTDLDTASFVHSHLNGMLLTPMKCRTTSNMYFVFILLYVKLRCI